MPVADPVRPWLTDAADAGADPRRRAPATLRNRDAILPVLRSEMTGTQQVLEIASGSGEHAVYFANALPRCIWQPSDADADSLASISAWSLHADQANVRPPLHLDVTQPDWTARLPSRIDAILCCNMVHIAPWAAAEGLFCGAGAILPAGAPLILYGPFIEDDVPTAPSNVAFDENLRARNAAWGLRTIVALDALASAAGLHRTARHVMPANNLTLVWRRD